MSLPNSYEEYRDLLITRFSPNEPPKYPCPLCYSWNLQIHEKNKVHRDDFPQWYVACNESPLVCSFEINGFYSDSAIEALEAWDDNWERTQESRKKNCKRYRREKNVLL